jgi:hypothetical protein
MRSVGILVAGLALAVLAGTGCVRHVAPMLAPGVGAAMPPAADVGPTLSLSPWHSGGAGIPAGDFTYFIPLISPEPVQCHTSPANGMQARLSAIERRTAAAGGFTLSCRFELVGDGFIEHEIDHSEMVRRRADHLRNGGRLSHILGSIRMEGEGSATIEAEGTLVAGEPVVERVVVAFASRGARSPVRIVLHTLSGPPDAWNARTEALGDVATLAFTRGAEPARMGVTLAGLRDPDAGEGLADRFKAVVKGTVANLLVPPLDIDARGNAAMLDFAAALVSGAPTFTFPRAANLRPGGRSQARVGRPAPGTAGG